jgi:transcriptional regulator with XRE-family HTH domain
MKRKTSIPKIIGQNIKTYRGALGLTQFELAEKLGISTTYLAELEITKAASCVVFESKAAAQSKAVSYPAIQFTPLSLSIQLFRTTIYYIDVYIFL